MGKRIILALWFSHSLISSQAWAAACCAGGGPRSFISLAPLQNYALVASTSVKDAFGFFDEQSVLRGQNTRRRFQVLLGGAARIQTDTELSLTIPIVYQVSQFGTRTASTQALGDLQATVRYRLVESLYDSDPYPSISVFAGIRLPTGQMEKQVGTALLPATGEGTFAPVAGIGFQKRVKSLTFDISATYTAPIAAASIKPGDEVNTAFSLSYAATQRLNLFGNVSYNMRLDDQRQGKPLSGSGGGALEGGMGIRYFATRFWSMALSLDTAFGGQNYLANQSVAISTSYGFY